MIFAARRVPNTCNNNNDDVADIEIGNCLTANGHCCFPASVRWDNGRTRRTGLLTAAKIKIDD